MVLGLSLTRRVPSRRLWLLLALTALASARASAADPPPSDRWRSHWAFTVPAKPAAPEPKRRGWARNPIDAFILARLEKEGLEPSPEADRLTLLRRLHLDLTGLPPTDEEIVAYLAEPPAEACGRIVEKLLASPHYGER